MCLFRLKRRPKQSRIENSLRVAGNSARWCIRTRLGDSKSGNGSDAGRSLFYVPRPEQPLYEFPDYVGDGNWSDLYFRSLLFETLARSWKYLMEIASIVAFVSRCYVRALCFEMLCTVRRLTNENARRTAGCNVPHPLAAADKTTWLLIRYLSESL